MSPAQPARAAPRTKPRKPPPRGRAAAPPIMRVRWDRVGRVSLLIVLSVVLGLYINQAITYFSVHSQADAQIASALSLARQNRQLAAEQARLRNPATIQREARALGMVRQGERPYVITGVPGG